MVSGVYHPSTTTTVTRVLQALLATATVGLAGFEASVFSGLYGDSSWYAWTFFHLIFVIFGASHITSRKYPLVIVLVLEIFAVIIWLVATILFGIVATGAEYIYEDWIYYYDYYYYVPPERLDAGRVIFYIIPVTAGLTFLAFIITMWMVARSIHKERKLRNPPNMSSNQYHQSNNTWENASVVSAGTHNTYVTPAYSQGVYEAPTHATHPPAMSQQPEQHGMTQYTQQAQQHNTSYMPHDQYDKPVSSPISNPDHSSNRTHSHSVFSEMDSRTEVQK